MNLIEALVNMPTLAMIVFIAGIICLAIEMFQPGFGVAGGVGVVLLFTGIVMTAQNFMQGLIMSGILIVVLALLLILLLRSAARGRLSKRLILKESMDDASAFSGTEDMSCLLGHTGKSVTVLRPSGSAEIDGVRLDVVTRGEYIPADTTITVVKVEGNRIVVAAA